MQTSQGLLATAKSISQISNKGKIESRGQYKQTADDKAIHQFSIKQKESTRKSF